MKYIPLVIFVIFASILAGCSPVQRLYIHNKSDETIFAIRRNPNAEPVKIRSGATKWVSINMSFPDSSSIESCFTVSIREATRSYSLPKSILLQTRSTGYGGRLDVNYEYGLFHFQGENGEWVQLKEVERCAGI